MLTNPQKITITGLRYYYLRIFKEFPTGLHGRQDKADEYIAGLGHPTIKTYYDYYKSIEMGNPDQLFVLQTIEEQQQSASFLAASRFEIGHIQQRLKMFTPQLIGDEELVEEIKDKSLLKILKQCFDVKTRTNLHEYILAIIFSFVCIVFLSFPIYYATEIKRAKIVAFGSQYGYRYNPRVMANALGLYTPKINFLNNHLSEVLKQAKQESLNKIANKKLSK